MQTAGEMNILVVGEPTGEGSQAALSLAKSRPHCRIALAGNPAEALSRLEEACFDLVLVDENLDHKEQILNLGQNSTTRTFPPRYVVGPQGVSATPPHVPAGGRPHRLTPERVALEEMSRTADRQWETRRLRERQQLLLSYLGSKGAYGPCSTG